MKGTEDHFVYLDRLRECGIINMYGAALYLESAFGITKSEATSILVEWMKTFSERHKEE